MLYQSWLLALALVLTPSAVHTQVNTNNWNPPPGGSGSGSNGNPANLPRPGQSPTTCNGSALFCSLRYDQYTFPATWRSGSYELEPDCTSSVLFPAGCQVFSVNKCFFHNHANRDLLRQLSDGIRGFNFQLCTAGTAPQNDYARLCRTVSHQVFGTARMFGEDFMNTAEVLKFWLDLPANRNEVIELEFDSVEAPINTNMQYVIDQLNEKIGKYLLRRTDSTRPWPSLGRMISANKRVVVFVNETIYNALTSTPPNWLLRMSEYYLPSSAYTQTAMPAEPPNNFDPTYDAMINALVSNVPYNLAHFCKHPDNGLLANRWQNLDMEFHLNYKCPVQIANSIQYYARQIAFFCLKYTYFHRLRAMTYFVGLEMRSLVRRINLARYALLLQAIQNQQTVT